MAKPTKCDRCGRENDPSFAFCLDCGQSLRSPLETQNLCSGCGAVLATGFRFCGQCGKPVARPPAATPRPAPAPERGPTGTGFHSVATPPPAPTSPHPAPAPLPRGPAVRLALVRNDGQPGAVFPVDREEVLCGRTEGGVRLADDATVSPRHARFTLRGNVLRVEDLGSVNGTFLRIRAPRRLAAGEELRVGRQLLRLDPLPPPSETGGVRPWGGPAAGSRLRLSQVLEGGGLGEVFPLREGENAVGRDAGEVTFPSDRYVSARHARVDVVGGAATTVVDLGSSNGTFVRISGLVELAPGDLLLVGGQLLRVEG